MQHILITPGRPQKAEIICTSVRRSIFWNMFNFYDRGWGSNFLLILLLAKMKETSNPWPSKGKTNVPNQQSWRQGVCLVSGAMVLDADQPALIQKRGFLRSIHLFLGHGQAWAKNLFFYNSCKSPLVYSGPSFDKTELSPFLSLAISLSDQTRMKGSTIKEANFLAEFN